MIKIAFALLLAFPMAMSSFAQMQKHRFDITGKLSGFLDSTKIYLYRNENSQAILMDSAILLNDRFHFTGTMEANVCQVILQTKGPNNYKFFWTEPGNMTFTAVKEKFKQAVITGSKTQDEQEKYDATVGNDKEKAINYIRTHPHSIVGANTLYVMASTWGKDTSTSLYHNFSQEIKNTPYGKHILLYITLSKNPGVGDPYADFTEPNVKGKNISLSDYKGKVVLLDFWGSWCGPCRKNNPELVKLYQEFNHKGFEILGIAADTDKKDWLDAVKKDGMTWQNVTDLNGMNNKAAMIYGIHKYPTSYLIDKKGIIVAMDLQNDALRSKLQELFQ